MNLTVTAEQNLAAAAAALASGAEAIGLALGERQQDALVRYLALLDKWNRVYNLTAVRDIGKMVAAHVLDCLAVVPHLRGGRVLDVGSGAGLPGIPLAVARPDWRVALLDSNHKKAAFLRQAVAELGLGNASVVRERVESWRSASEFDVIISRAYADIADFVQQSRHLLAPGGVFAAMKGLHPYEEIERLPQAYALRDAIELQVPGLQAARRLILIAPK
ncbi:MAG: 16S rRNA (guanine(527)-N(7))-methyltransferase RsmG [Betaproteobacteria bacterium]|nr:16S rRNA (guanine(527)-N(7))-methyltransferase RsmG [Betaproteobacteria bacterium]MBI2960251.1 16S rRNA (guanine(527)-N(7))-methyltransferase RsmG [Betaproteobacteria bacterium]